MPGHEHRHHHPEEDIAHKIPIQMVSTPFIPFWLLTLSKFLLFLTHNMITALSTTIYGHSGSWAMTIMYIAFIFGNFLAPAINAKLGHNMALVMLCVSIIYTLFAFVSTAVVFASGSPTLALSQATMTVIFFSASCITGLAGGALWIGYGVLNIQLGELIPKKLLNKYLENHLLDPEQNVDSERILDHLTEAVTGKIMSIGWSLLSLNTVIGGLLTFAILNLFKGPNALDFLFVVFSFISILANISYFILYKYCSAEMATGGEDKKTKEIPSPTAGPITTATSPVLFPKQPNENDGLSFNGNGEEAAMLLNSNVNKPNKTQTTSVYGSTSAETEPDCRDEIIREQEYTQWEIFIGLMKTRYVWWSSTEYVFAGIAFNFVFASFMSNTVKNTLGLPNAPLIVAAAYTTNTFASFFIGNFINSRLKARTMAIFGNIIQLTPAILALTSAPAQFGSYDAWLFALAVAAFAGAGDAIHMSSLSTVMASDLNHDTDLGGARFKHCDDVVRKELKEILYSIYSSVKSVGVFLTFLLSGAVSFEVQSTILILLGLGSLVSQYVLRRRVLQQEVY